MSQLFSDTLGRQTPAFFFPSSSSLLPCNRKAHLSSRASWAEIPGAGGVTQAISPTPLPPSLLAGQSLRRSAATPPAWLCKPGREAAILVRAGCYGAFKGTSLRGRQQQRRSTGPQSQPSSQLGTHLPFRPACPAPRAALSEKGRSRREKPSR